MTRRSLRSLLSLILCLSLAAWTGSESEPEPESGEAASQAPPVSSVIGIEATNYAFTAPPTFPSGWVTLRFDNVVPETHFMLLWRLPEGKTFDDYFTDISKPFNDLYKEYRSGALEQGDFLQQLGEALPDWFGDAQRMGGPGFTSPGYTSQTTVYLEPGDYVMECYVRSEVEEDTFHSKHGMLRPLIVTETVAAEAPPEADMEITLSNYEIAFSGEPTPGEHTVRVRVDEDPEGLILHNVHLAKLDEDVAVEDVAQWLDWVDHMLPPAPAEFLGGAGQITAGNESYFTVTLEQGRYAWVSETWGVQGMVHEFTVE